MIEKYRTAGKALTTLLELIMANGDSSIHRDAAIQRFEYTFEAVWKAAKLYLTVVEGIEAQSPKKVIRSCFQVSLLSLQDTEMALAMVDDRNLTSHTYHEGVAKGIYENIPRYADLMQRWLLEMAAMLPTEELGPGSRPAHVCRNDG